jgi:hypothetical protein
VVFEGTPRELVRAVGSGGGSFTGEHLARHVAAHAA